MEATIILKLAAIGILVAVAAQVLSRAGREDQATLVSLAGVALALLIVLDQIRELFAAVRAMFGL